MDVHCLTDKSMDIRPEKMFRGAIIRDCVVKNVVDGKTLKVSLRLSSQSPTFSRYELRNQSDTTDAPRFSPKRCS